MSDKKMVKDYQSEKEDLVLSLVKKYPLYSVDKLDEELPEISRHSIQRILEKNDLSTVEKRLTFSEEKGKGFLPTLKGKKMRLEFFRGKKFNLKSLKNLLMKLQEKPRINWRLVVKLAVLGVLAFILWLGVDNFVLAKPPYITLDQPSMGFVNEGERLFVIGKVMPVSSVVTVNGNEVPLNGDGSFTAVVNLPMGESILEVGATNRRKEAKVICLVKRVPTQEELRAQEEKEAEKKRETIDKAAELDGAVTNLMAAKNVVMNPESGKKGLLRILNNRVKGEKGFQSVIGEVVNLGKQAVSWVMVTANFFDETGNKVDQKHGFATDFGEVIKLGEKAEFETQVTMKEFDYYNLELSWEEGVVAGVATESEERKKATVSGEIID